MTKIVPRDLLNGLDLNRHRRLVLLGWILSEGRSDDGPALKRAHDLIPPMMLETTDAVQIRTVAAGLIELRGLGLIKSFRLELDGHFHVEAT